MRTNSWIPSNASALTSVAVTHSTRGFDRGFTQVLLEAGAAHVVAVDVGYGQLAWPLQQDSRVTVLDRTNVRHLRAEDLPYAPDLVVADLSFISLTKVLGPLASVADAAADFVLLVKPQFEVGKGHVGKVGWSGIRTCTPGPCGPSRQLPQIWVWVWPAMPQPVARTKWQHRIRAVAAPGRTRAF